MRRVICRPLRGLSRRRHAQPYPGSMFSRRRRRCARVRQEEADHLPAGVGAASVRVGAADTAAGPSMAPAGTHAQVPPRQRRRVGPCTGLFLLMSRHRGARRQPLSRLEILLLPIGVTGLQNRRRCLDRRSGRTPDSRSRHVLPAPHLPKAAGAGLGRRIRQHCHQGVKDDLLARKDLPPNRRPPPFPPIGSH
jgi:hypothetical protein